MVRSYDKWSQIIKSGYKWSQEVVINGHIVDISTHLPLLQRLLDHLQRRHHLGEHLVRRAGELDALVGLLQDVHKWSKVVTESHKLGKHTPPEKSEAEK